MLPSTAVVLARLDPLSLEPVSGSVEVGEYHDAWSMSPDGSHVALARGGQGIGVVIVDLDAMKVVRKVQTGIAAEELGWLAPRLLVAGLQRGGTVVVDPRTGEILRRWPRFSDPQASARTPQGLVMLFPGPLPTASVRPAARLAVVDVRGRLRSVTLERIRLALRDGVQWDEAGLAVDPRRARAYVFAADAPVAEVDLRTMRFSYHRVEPLFMRPREVRGSEAQPDADLSWRYRRALWLGDGRVLVFGGDDLGPSSEGSRAIATGAMLVHTATWSACLLDAGAGGAAFVGGRVLVYGRGDRSSLGLRAYTVDGREAFRLFEREQVSDVNGAGHLAYVSGRVLEISRQGGPRSAFYVVDVSSGKVVTEIRPAAELVDVIAGSS